VSRSSPQLAGVILAAGRASRMGSPKALLSLPTLAYPEPLLPPGATILEALVAAYRASGLATVLVVAAGPTWDAARTLEGAAVAEGDPSAPMVDSLARALELLPADVDGVIAQPVDAPFTSASMIRALTRGWSVHGAPRVLTSAGTPGHPVLVPRALFAAIRERPEGGLRRLLEGRAEPIEWADARVLADLDTLEDLARYGGAEP
jgi:molybdenum cofactor cytidylyltransferase